MHPPEVREAAMALIREGINDCEISRRLGIPRRTIMDWRRPTYVSRREVPVETCPRCWRAAKPIRCTPDDYVELLGLYLGDGCISKHARTFRLRMPCLLPQHGPGLKHLRLIELEPWQRELLDVAPWPFIRACIRTDGCSFINRTDIHRDVPYEYLSYQFSNMSTDIVDLFLEACARVGVCTRANRRSNGLWSVRINRRESVALLLEHVGEKV
jgi:hypothetical protein